MSSIPSHDEGSLPETEQDSVASAATKDDIFEKPWKYVGYMEYTRFLGSDDDLYILRQFSSLNIRIALALQDEISALDQELLEMDRQHSKKESEDVHNGTFRDDQQDRSELIRVIAKKLRLYSK